MRSCHIACYPLIGAAAAALLALQLPATAIAAGEGPAAAATASTPGTPSVPVVTAQPAAPDASGTATPEPAAAATAEKPKPLPPTLIARINLTTQTMVVQAGNKTLHTWKVSSGAPGYATPPGTFKPGWMAKMWNSRQYDDAPMPHSVFFNGGIAVHATTSVHNLGRAASHGCVRLAPGNAAQFFKMVSSHSLARTRIIVHGQQPFSAQTERIAKLNKSKPAVRTASASAQWYVAPGSVNNGYGSANRRQRRGDTYAYDGTYNGQAPQRRANVVKAQSTYWGGF
jgi:lipoprotein-anchoring transpeptidase ErfK/SrfK